MYKNHLQLLCKSTVIAAYDNMNVFMPTDYILIPQGNDNVELTGKVKLNPSKGNPFIFLN